MHVSNNAHDINEPSSTESEPLDLNFAYSNPNKIEPSLNVTEQELKAGWQDYLNKRVEIGSRSEADEQHSSISGLTPNTADTYRQVVNQYLNYLSSSGESLEQVFGEDIYKITKDYIQSFLDKSEQMYIVVRSIVNIFLKESASRDLITIDLEIFKNKKHLPFSQLKFPLIEQYLSHIRDNEDKSKQIIIRNRSILRLFLKYVAEQRLGTDFDAMGKETDDFLTAERSGALRVLQQKSREHKEFKSATEYLHYDESCIKDYANHLSDDKGRRTVTVILSIIRGYYRYMFDNKLSTVSERDVINPLNSKYANRDSSSRLVGKSITVKPVKAATKKATKVSKPAATPKATKPQAKRTPSKAKTKKMMPSKKKVNLLESWAQDYTLRRKGYSKDIATIQSERDALITLLIQKYDFPFSQVVGLSLQDMNTTDNDLAVSHFELEKPVTIADEDKEQFYDYGMLRSQIDVDYVAKQNEGPLFLSGDGGMLTVDDELYTNKRRIDPNILIIHDMRDKLITDLVRDEGIDFFAIPELRPEDITDGPVNTKIQELFGKYLQSIRITDLRGYVVPDVGEGIAFPAMDGDYLTGDLNGY